MDRDVDVLVVGAGPAGSWAAKHAAERGARTLLIEKRQEIGTPVRCGEGIAGNWLEEARVPEDASFIAHRSESARVIAPDGSCLLIDFAGSTKAGYIIERDLFDRFLARQAAKAGAEILVKTTAFGLLEEDGRVVGARCEHFGETFDVHAKVVVGADGFESQIGRWAGLTAPLRARDVVSCLQYTLAGVEGEPDYADFYLGSVAPGGYAWVFWKGEDLANVGLGIPLSRLRGRAEPKAYLDRFIARHPGLAKGEVIEEVAGGVSASLPVDRSVAPGLLLVGDAARLIDPLSGAGIRNALLSGMYAGQAAAQAVEAGDITETALGGYERRWRARLEEELARHYLIKEALQVLDDTSVSTIVRAIAEARPARLDVKTVLSIVAEKCPEVLGSFRALLG